MDKELREQLVESGFEVDMTLQRLWRPWKRKTVSRHLKAGIL